MYLYEGAAEKEEEREKLEVIVRRPAEKCYCKPHKEHAEEEEDKSILNTSVFDNSIFIPKEDEDLS